MNETTEETTEALNRHCIQGIYSTDELIDRNNKIDTSIAASLISQNLDPKLNFKTPLEKGQALEKVAAYFMDNCGLFSDTQNDYKNNQHQIDHWGEIDFYLKGLLSGKGIELMSVLGESKNYETKNLKVDVVYKVEGLKFILKAGIGIYFTRKGLTGVSYQDDAQGVLQSFYQKGGHISIVFTDDDWSFLKTKPKKFNSLFFRKILLYTRNFELCLTPEMYQDL